jgi:hypothetical protein
VRLNEEQLLLVSFNRGNLTFNPLLSRSEFNKLWAEKIKAKEAVEVELQKVVKEKALADMSNWVAQRNVRLKAKKVI